MENNWFFLFIDFCLTFSQNNFFLQNYTILKLFNNVQTSVHGCSTCEDKEFIKQLNDAREQVKGLIGMKEIPQL